MADIFWSIESAAGFTAQVDRTGEVTYQDLEPDPVEVARAAGATEQHWSKKDTFYKPAYPNGPMLQMSVNGTAGEWKRARNYLADCVVAI